jgi:hypothetical protein
VARALAPLRRCQLGIETTWGVGAPATYIAPSLNDIRWQPTDTIYRAEKLNGSLARYDNAKAVGKSAVAPLNGYCCPQFMPYILDSAYSPATPTSDVGTPVPAQTRIWAPLLTGEDSPVSRTLEVGSNITADQWRIRGGLPTNFKITGKIGEPAMLTSDWIGRALEVFPFTASLTAGDYTEMAAKAAKFWVDDVDGTIGTTLIADCVTEFAFDSGALWALVNCIDGSLEASGFAQQRQEPSLTLTIQLSPTTQAYFADMEAGQQKLVRMLIPGALIHTAVSEMVQIDLAAHITTFPEVGGTEAEGGLVAAITFSGSEDNTGGAFGKLIEYTVVNDLAAVA